MNVSCPSCAAQFRIADAHLAKGPRKVRCGKCGHVWPVSRASAEPPRARPRPAAAEATPAAAPGPAPMPPPPPPQPTAAPVATAPKAPARAERRGGSLWIWWLLLLLVIAGIAAGGYFARAWLVDVWPPATRLYDWIGIDLPRVEIVARSEESAGEGATRRLTIGGTLANHAEHALPVPPLLYTLYDDEGAVLNQWSDPPPVAELAPGATADFVSTIGIARDDVTWDVTLLREAVEGIEGDDTGPDETAPDETAHDRDAGAADGGHDTEPTEDDAPADAAGDDAAHGEAGSDAN